MKLTSNLFTIHTQLFMLNIINHKIKHCYVTCVNTIYVWKRKETEGKTTEAKEMGVGETGVKETRVKAMG